MAFAAIRKRHPQMPEEEVQLLYLELAYGAKLAGEVRRWQAEKQV